MFGPQTPQGAWALHFGDYLIGASGGVFRYSPATNTFTPIITGVSAQYINPIWLPEPATVGASRARRCSRCHVTAVRPDQVTG